MKVYFNIDLEFSSLNEMIKDLSKLNNENNAYLKIGCLNEKENLAQLLSFVEGSAEVYFYNYQSLQLTLSEFNRVKAKLEAMGVTIIFLDEENNFYNQLVFIMNIEQRIISARRIESVKEARKKGKIIGRPSLESELQEKIHCLYKENKMSMREIATTCNVSLGTVHKYVYRK
ncbi:recombinase family protein [Vagococcus sp. BWB3-3]|uniref:Recombinase family protein n=1 Tax=Vagococcus allomyrinae TaxID=2794353 RepID=A0A940SW04_9ENTE|nr:winged helix-turn-helix transcriptional regulator [Vagococcus allomyrinae]MBP1042449.1 recombinase family protein [Vagococcus allomyrinae]